MQFPGAPHPVRGSRCMWPRLAAGLFHSRVPAPCMRRPGHAVPAGPPLQRHRLAVSRGHQRHIGLRAPRRTPGTPCRWLGARGRFRPP